MEGVPNVTLYAYNTRYTITNNKIKLYFFMFTKIALSSFFPNNAHLYQLIDYQGISSLFTRSWDNICIICYTYYSSILTIVYFKTPLLVST